MTKSSHTFTVKQFAKQLGFDYCGIAKAEFLEEEAPHLEKWFKQPNAWKNGLHAKLF